MGRWILSQSGMIDPSPQVRALRQATMERRNSEAEGRAQAEARTRVQSETTAPTVGRERGKRCEKSQSLVNVRRRTVTATKESIEERDGEKRETAEAEEGGEEESPPPGKRLTNLKDFYKLTKENERVNEEKEKEDASKEEDKKNKVEDETTSPCKEAAPESPDGGGEVFDWVGGFICWVCLFNCVLSYLFVLGGPSSSRQWQAARA